MGLGLLLGVGGPARAELTADQVAIVVNRRSPDSVAVGRHYAERRGVPPARIIALDLGPVRETATRQEYDRDLAGPLRRALQDAGLASTVRALVTVYGVPLRVLAAPDGARERQWREDAAARQQHAWSELAALASRWRAAPGPGPAAPDPPAGAAAAAEALAALASRLEADLGNAARRSRGADEDGTLRAAGEVGQAAQRAGGLAAVLRHLGPPPGSAAPGGSDPRSTLERAINRARLTMSVLQKSPVAADRDRAYRLAELAFGLIGLWRQAALERQALDPATGDASVDSELSLLWWEGGVYGLGGRLANPLHHAFGATADHPQATLPVLMVSRLDAPTPALARQLVDRALAAERDGLEGRVYLDARGIYGSGPHRPGSYGAYDRDLQDTADLFRRTGRYPVELETTEARFSAPGQAPDVAVYAGWYRLRRYEDAFTFRTGALGYHIASNEAVSIHDPAEGGWCKNALERGITVTLGSIDEPYLDAFPLPQELFGLLLTGRYTLVEAYYLTTRYVSWRMVLFGDPLYNPWRGRNLVAADAIRLPTARPGWTGLPRAPTELPFLDPAAAQARLQAERQALLAGADRLLTELDTAAAGPVP